MLFFKKISDHKWFSGIATLVIVLSGYYGYQSYFGASVETRYVIDSVKKGSLIVSVSGSGQVESLNQMVLKPKASGDIFLVEVKDGQSLKIGTVIAQIDSRDAKKTVRDAEVNLASAKLTLEKLKKPVEPLDLLQAENAISAAQESKKTAERTIREKEEALSKLKKGADALEILQAENSLETAKDSKVSAEDRLKKTRSDGFTAVANGFLDFPNIIDGPQTVFFDTGGFDKSQVNIDWYLNRVPQESIVLTYKYQLEKSYQSAKAQYETNFSNYKSTTRDSDAALIDALIFETYETAKLITSTVKNGNNFLDYVKNYMDDQKASYPSLVNTHKSSLTSWSSTINTNLTGLFSATQNLADAKNSLLSADRAIQEKTESLEKLKKGAEDIEIIQAENSLAQAKESLKSAERSIAEKSEFLAKLKKGPDVLDIKSAELTVKQRQNALLDAQEKLSDYIVKAPFDGIVTKLNVKKGDAVGPSTVISSFVTEQQIAEISLNEVDAARIKQGQKSTLTFDALPDLTITGKVTELDTVGTVSQGVVTYMVKIVFDIQDENVKPGMSVSASIITDSKSDVLMVPNSTIKSMGNGYAVDRVLQEDIDPSQNISDVQGIVLNIFPSRQEVVLGVSNDESTEIMSGLEEGDLVVVRTVNPQNGQSSQQRQQSLFPIPGGGGGGGGGIRNLSGGGGGGGGGGAKSNGGGGMSH